MTTNDDNGRPPIDWERYENEVGDPDGPADGAAEVVDLDKARSDKARDKARARRGEADMHYSTDIDDEPSPGGMPVDPPPGGVVKRHAIIPPALRGWGMVKSTVKHRVGVAWYHVAFHAVRAPWYTVQALFWGAVGVFRLAGRQLDWWWLTEVNGLKQHAADEEDSAEWHKLHREQKNTRRWRGIVLTVEVVALLVLVPIAWATVPWWARLPLLGLVVAGLAHVGHPADRPIVSAAVVKGRFRRINPDIVLRAYYAAGLGNPDKEHLKVEFGSAMSRDATDAGSQVVIDLPYGKTFEQVLNARGAIASGLDVSVNQVYLTKDPTSHRRHVLFVADRDPLAIAAGKTPLLALKPTDIWSPAPLGLDERGRKVGLLLMWISVLVGAQPRKGKTFFARLLALYAGLDPYTVMIVVDGKMSADWDKFRLIAHRYVCGVVPNSRDDNPIENLLSVLREIKKHIEQVNDFLAKLPTAECPEGKITRELSRKYPLLRVWVLVMEEFQNYFETDDQDINKEIAALLSFIMAVGPSAGVIIVSSSQKPSGVGAGDVSRLFNRYRDNHAVRFALKCGNRVVSEAVLGGDAYAEGFDASTLPVGDGSNGTPDYRGIGILYGATDNTPIVRTYLADHPDAEKILIAARKFRESAGTLTGDAAGEKVAREVRDVLADVRSVFLPGENGLHWSTIAERLADRMPERYADITPKAASAMLREHVRSVNVNVRGTVNKGARVADVDAAINGRKSA